MTGTTPMQARLGDTDTTLVQEGTTSTTVPTSLATAEESARRMSSTSDVEMLSAEVREERIAPMQKEAHEVQREQEKYQRLLRSQENGYLPLPMDPLNISIHAREPHGNCRSSSPLQTEADARRQKIIGDGEKNIALPTVKEYKGENHKEFRDWERQLEVCLETRPTSFDGDSQKIMFALGKLTATAGEAWTRVDHGQNPTWDEFVQFLKQQITSDAGIGLEDLAGWCNCKQGSRTVRAVVNEIDDFESRMERFPEAIRINVLVLAMRASLRKELMRTGVLPTTRESAIAQAMTLEQAESRFRLLEPRRGHVR